ncbi:MAG: Cys-tRNA(Pro) deacylase [Anaeromicrobium sp.]|jgi:Cys-tRNA(Pro)/Cys-tRNA(Cys) deacylase|uniref:Cys-tRNA(Pro) deacylase n=1 Tax=Anaeromicrobium sp. TaxID=1929132 RepID=UPI0025EC698C|nr:Cys-tRNA(Pro) deacylase [Anaeromicrobium sp.]MCT4593801.1 Cys-tRNA(Pro) deacylase [Anaeromicrobium sp.]
MKKTNAARILDRHKVEYDIKTYEVDENDLSAIHVANDTGKNIEKIFKTLVLKNNKNGILVACIPGDKNVNFKSLAKVSGNKKVEMIPLKDVQKITGYIRGGVSPIGMKKAYATFIHESALEFRKIYVSAGIRGQQLYLDPKDLIKVVNGTVANIIE